MDFLLSLMDINGNIKVSAEPEVVVLELSGEERCVVLACDGIFDVMSNDESGLLVARALEEGCGVREVAGSLIKRAFAKKSEDNLTAIVALVRTQAPPQHHHRLISGGGPEGLLVVLA